MERITGQSISEGFTTADMQRGIDLEEIARARYEAASGNMVDQVGFVKHPKIEGFGASPDGLIGEDGLVEIKCPSMAVHVGYWLDEVVPSEYQDQMMAQLACTGRKWCDFVSFDDRVAEDMQLFIIRFEPKPEEIKKLENEVIQFLVEVDKDLTKINLKRKSK
jgi:predicted phage-related endonuclease